MDWKKYLRLAAAYALPALTAMEAGQHNPLPASSPYRPLVAPAAALLAAFIQMRLHPNGVNGPAK